MSLTLNFNLICIFIKVLELNDILVNLLIYYSFSSVSQLGLILCDPMDCSTPGCSVHHQLLELAQTHVHQGGDAIQRSPPLLSPSPPPFNLS